VDQGSNPAPTLATPATTTFTYDGDGLRRQTVTSAGTTNFIWDRQDVLLETDAGNTTQVTYTQTPDIYGDLVSQRRSTTTKYYHFDALGSTLALTDSNENVTDTYRYYAFGKTLTSSGNTVNNLRFADDTCGKCISCTDCRQPYLFNIHIIGSHGTLWNTKFWSTQLEGLRSDEWVELPTTCAESGDVLDHPYPPQVDHFVDCLLQDRDSFINFEEAFKTHQVLFAIEESLAEGRPIEPSSGKIS